MSPTVASQAVRSQTQRQPLVLLKDAVKQPGLVGCGHLALSPPAACSQDEPFSFVIISVV